MKKKAYNNLLSISKKKLREKIELTDNVRDRSAFANCVAMRSVSNES